MSYYSDASLVLIPSGYKDQKVYSAKPTDGSGDLVFSRASDATRVDSNGLIEKVRTNLLRQSNTFDTSWIAPTSTATGGQAGYDGTNNAWELEATATAGRIVENIVAGGLKTFSVYAKAGTTDGIALRVIDGITNTYVLYNLNNGNYVAEIGGGAISPSTQPVDSLGGGWYRFRIVTNSTSADVRIYTSDSSGTIVGSGTIFIQNAQLETGDIATDYIPTTSAAVSVGPTPNVPRLDYSGGCPSLLLEPSRTNLIPYSEYLGGSAWSKANLSITDNATTSPEGVSNAAQLTESASGSSLRAVFEQFTPSLGTYTFSGFLKQGSLQYGGIRAIVNGGANRFFVNVNLSTGTITDTNTVGTGVTWTYGIEDYGNGWHRLWISAAHSVAGFVDLTYALSNSATPTYTSALPIYNGSGSDYIYAYGAQIEAGSYPTSYIPTYGTSATRTADSAYKTGISSLIGQTEGTLFGHLVFDSAEPTNRILSITGTNWSDSSLRFDIISNQGQGTIRSAGVDIAKIYATGTISKGDEVKFAFVYTALSVKLFINGALRGSATPSASLPSTSELHIDALGGGFSSTSQNNQLNPYKQALVFKTALTDAEAIALTSL